MKALPIILCGFLMFALQAAMANGSTATSPSDRSYNKQDDKEKWIPRPSRGMTKMSRRTTKEHRGLTKHQAGYEDRMLVVDLYSGSLKANIIRIAHNCGWYTVIWNVPEDYTWVGSTQIAAPDLAGALFKILLKYPVQAQLYQGNQVLAIVPRNLP